MGYDLEAYEPTRAYSRSKKANLIFAAELQKRMNANNVDGLALSLHPGLVRTDLVRDMLDNAFKKIIFYAVAVPLLYIFTKSTE